MTSLPLLGVQLQRQLFPMLAAGAGCACAVAPKVMCHLMFGLIALTAAALFARIV